MGNNRTQIANRKSQIAIHEWRWVAIVSSLILALTIALNVWGEARAPSDLQFSGLAYNWQDGNSYLAKLRQGARGEWLYSVPFTAEPGDGVFLYPHYLLLGHISAWLGVEPILVFNMARLLASAVLLFSLYHFMRRFFRQIGDRRLAWLIAVTGSGLGWVAVVGGKLTPDLWQAEIFPFLSMLSNPHFPLTIAAMLWLMDALVNDTPSATPRAWRRLLIGALILALLQPYGLVIVGATTALWIGVRWFTTHALPRRNLIQLVVITILSAPFALYAQWAVLSTPALAGWDQQNLTRSAPIWDYGIAIGLIAPLAVIGVRHAAWRRTTDDWLLLLWTAASLVLMYLPFYTQQRRFASGLFVPLVVLAVWGLLETQRLNRSFARRWLAVSCALTNLTLFLLIIAAMDKNASYLYFTRNEWNGLMYLRAHADPHALVLASPDMGLYIPAWSGQRVIYGHPHETANAKARATEAQQFYEGKPLVALTDVDFIFVGPRERTIGAPSVPADFAPVFADGDVTIYARK